MIETDLRSPLTLSRHAALPASDHPWLAELHEALVDRGFTVARVDADQLAYDAFVSGASVVVWPLAAVAAADDQGDGQAADQAAGQQPGDAEIAAAWQTASERSPKIMPVTAVWTEAADNDLAERCIAVGFDELFHAGSDPIAAAARLAGRTSARAVHHSLAARDPLTGLVTQQVFFSRLDPTVRLSSRASMPMAVAVLDLDHMRRLEERCGRAVVRRVLGDVSAHLQRVLRRSDTIARLGDDRFGLILHHITAFEARKLLYKLWKGMCVEPETQAACSPELSRVTFTAGVAVFPGDSSDGMELYTRAEIALDVARATGQRRVLLYSETAGDAGAQSGSTDLRYHRVDSAGRADVE